MKLRRLKYYRMQKKTSIKIITKFKHINVRLQVEMHHTIFFLFRFKENGLF